MSKYKFYTDNKSIVVCTTHFHGDTVKGIAKCSPEDEFNLGIGEAIAKARCEYNFFRKKKAHALSKLREAQDALDRAKFEVERMEDYYDDTALAAANALSNLLLAENKY